MEEPFLGVYDTPVHTRDKTLVLSGFGPARRRVLKPYLGTVEEKVKLFRSVVLYLFVKVEKTAAGISYPSPAALAEGYVVDGVFVVEALVKVYQLVDVQLTDFPKAGAARAASLGMVEAERVRVPHKRLSHA